jgi:hypothetical protein
MDASIIISAIALLVSIIVGVRQLILQSRVTRIEEARRREEVASKLTAELTARFESYRRTPTSQARAYRFVLENLGPARAQDVSFEIQAPANGEAPSVQMEGHTFPIPLDPKQEYRMGCIRPHGTASAVNVDLRWKDGTGPRAKTVTLAVR